MSPTSNRGDSPGGDEGIWHPALEWLEEDEQDVDYTPHPEPNHVEAWVDEMPIEDEAMGMGVTGSKLKSYMHTGRLTLHIIANALFPDTRSINIGNVQILLPHDDAAGEGHIDRMFTLRV